MDAPSTFGRREWQLVYGVALRVLKTPDHAEDAAQEAMLRAYRARDTFSGVSRFDSWLYRIAFTTAVSYMRRPHYRRHMAAVQARDGDGELAGVKDPGQTPEDSARTAELAECLEGCLGEMGDIDRLAFTERFLHGTSERELGELLGVSTSAAKQRAFRARRAVRHCVLQKSSDGADDERAVPATDPASE